VVEVEEVAVGVLDGELSDAPGLQLEGVGDVGAGGLQVLVGGVDVFGEDPVDGWLEGGFPFAEEEGGFAAGHGAHFFAGGEPGDVEVEDVAVVVLGAFDVGYGEFGDGLAGDWRFLLGGHGRLLRKVPGGTVRTVGVSGLEPEPIAAMAALLCRDGRPGTATLPGDPLGQIPPSSDWQNSTLDKM
jgi:hypothetical protein